MATFDYVAWGNGLIGKWLLETGESGVYRGQCTQVVTQLLKDLGYVDYNVAHGNGNQVGTTMVVRGEADYVGINLTSIPANEIHIVCQDVGNFLTAGHVSVAAGSDIVFEENVTIAGLPVRNYGIGLVYPMRLGRLSEAFRSTRYHYKLTITTIYDNISSSTVGDPTDNPIGVNSNRYINGSLINTKKSKISKHSSIKNIKRFEIVPYTLRGINQDV